MELETTFSHRAAMLSAVVTDMPAAQVHEFVRYMYEPLLSYYLDFTNFSYEILDFWEFVKNPKKETYDFSAEVYSAIMEDLSSGSLSVTAAAVAIGLLDITLLWGSDGSLDVYQLAKVSFGAALSQAMIKNAVDPSEAVDVRSFLDKYDTKLLTL